MNAILSTETIGKLAREGRYEELPPMLTTTGAQEVTGASYRTIQRMLERGELKGARFGNRWHVSTDSLLRHAGLIG